MQPDNIERLAVSSNPDDHFRLGKLYLNGSDRSPKVDRNLIKAAAWFFSAATANHPEAQYRLASMQQNGTGIEKNFHQAYDWFLRSAEGGFRDSFNMLGYMCDRGEAPNPDGPGFKTDAPKAVSYFKKGADLGDRLAQYNLGVVYFDGRGTAKNYAKASHYFYLSAEQGYDCAMVKLGDMYKTGMGIARDDVTAQSYYLKAAQEGNSEAFAKLTAMNATTDFSDIAVTAPRSMILHPQRKIMRALSCSPA